MTKLISCTAPFSIGLCLIAVIGCGASAPRGEQATASSTESTSFDAATTQDNVAAVAVSEPPAKQIKLDDMNWEQVQALVAENKGKVVVVDIWSTSCEPCLREFPHLVALQQRHPGDVVCISFDSDFIGARNKPVEYYRERVLKALTDLNAGHIINVMSTVAADELFQQMDLDSIPAVYVFDREGKLAKRFDNRTPAGGEEEGISYEKQIDPLVAELVDAK